MEIFFKILAVILAGIAAYFLWAGNKDGAFLAGVFGAVAFFLSVRFQVKGRLAEREEERIRREEAEELEERFAAAPPSPLRLEDQPAHEHFDELPKTSDEQRTTNNEQRTTHDKQRTKSL